MAELHRKTINASEAKFGSVICVVTLHDAPLRQGWFFPVVLFDSGAVATWRQSEGGAEELFSATLTPAEQATSKALIAALPDGRALARSEFHASAFVMGVTTRIDGRLETLYFDNDAVPLPLGRLVSILKQRLEATNAKP